MRHFLIITVSIALFASAGVHSAGAKIFQLNKTLIENIIEFQPPPPPAQEVVVPIPEQPEEKEKFVNELTEFIDLIISRLEKIHALFGQEDFPVSEEIKQQGLAKIQQDIDWLSAMHPLSAATDQKLAQHYIEAYEYHINNRDGIQKLLGLSIKTRIWHEIDRTETFLQLVKDRKDQLAAKDIDVSALEDGILSFAVQLELTKDKALLAQEKFEQAQDVSDSFDLLTLGKTYANQSMTHLKTAKKKIRDAILILQKELSPSS